MFPCENLRVEVWHPSFSSSDQADPTWTRVFCQDRQLTNSLEWVEWTSNPVQVVLCDRCGTEGCASGGYVHVSRLEGFVLWSPAQDLVYEAPSAIRSLGALAIPLATWNELAADISDVPNADRLVDANYAAIADAWITGPGRSAETIVTYLREHLVGGDTLAKDHAITLVEQVLEVTRRHASETFRQPLVSPDNVGGRIETLYFDGPRELDWPAFAFVDGEPYLVLDRQHVTRVAG